MNAVFDIFDRKGCGLLDYQEFVEALRPERQVDNYESLLALCSFCLSQRTPRVRTGKKPITDTELITDEIEHQISHCQCRSQFKASKVGEGKYKVSADPAGCGFSTSAQLTGVFYSFVLTEQGPTDSPC